jgi:hypothetical protein
MMTWLIIVLILVVVIGPVMYLVPTAADKRLTNLRAAARGQGLNVQITSVPKLDPASHERVTAGGKRQDPRIQCAAYHLPLGENFSGLGNLMLMKLPDQPTVTVEEVTPGWGLSADSDQAFWQRYNAGGKGVAQLLHIVSQLPDDVLAVAFDSRSVACYWREKAAAEEGVVDRIADALTSVRDDLVARF